MFFLTSCQNEGFRKLGVQRITEILSFVLLARAFLPFSCFQLGEV